MTEADAKRLAGWYVLKHENCEPQCVFRYPSGDWALPNGRSTFLPFGWTVGPHINDLLRDAARLRVIVNIIVPEAGSFDPENEQQIEDIALEWAFSYYAAERDAARYRWCRKHDAILIAEEFLDAEITRERQPENRE